MWFVQFTKKIGFGLLGFVWNDGADANGKESAEITKLFGPIDIPILGINDVACESSFLEGWPK